MHEIASSLRFFHYLQLRHCVALNLDTKTRIIFRKVDDSPPRARKNHNQVLAELDELYEEQDVKDSKGRHVKCKF